MSLAKEEQEILNSYKRGKWHSVEHLKKELSHYQEIARATLKKNERINIRISTKDLEGIQKKAIAAGIPYQTLVSSLLHRYISGSLVEREA